MEEIYRLAIENSPIGNILVDEKGSIIFANSSSEKMFGYETGELIGHSLEILLPKKLADGHKKYRGAFVKHPTSREMGVGRELFGRTKDGGQIPVEIGLTSVKTGDKVFVMASIIDITLKKKVEELRTKQSFDQFAYIASHDLQSPIRQVTSYVQSLIEKYADSTDKETKQWVSYIVRGTTRIKAIMDSLVAFSSLSLDVPLEYVDLNSIVDDVLVLLKEKIQKSGATIDSKNLPKVLVRPSHFKELFYHLISNALKFCRPKTVPKITITATKEQEFWKFAVQDNGIGVNAKHFEKIFGLFQRLDPNKYKGRGLGLAMCKKIVELQGGKIWIESTENEGTTLHFTIRDFSGVNE